VFIYSTSPQKKIVARFQLGKIIKDHPDYLWEQYCDVSGLSEREFFEYFSDRDTGYAIKIDELEQFSEPVDPHMVFERFVAPQSFCYLDNRSLNNKRLKMRS
jgi:type I restriction enzyme, S subunit